jgi:signal transduction histidine kinase
MLSGLRVKLTLLYLAMGLALIALVAGISYFRLQRYFQSTTDLALQYRMAYQFRTLGLPLPIELMDAEETWRANWSNPAAVSTVRQGDEEGEDDYYEHEALEYAYEGELAAIFVIALDGNGKVIAYPNLLPSPIDPDLEAAQSALESGSDLRTVYLQPDTPVRLLTYRLPQGGPVLFFQLGRLMGDQERTLRQLITSLLILSSAAALAVVIASWWLAGRSIKPAQQAWEQQQAFVANASHELRAPLTLIQASVEYAARKPLENEQKELLDDVLHECDHMNKLVDDLLMLSRLDSGRLILDREPLPLPEFIAELQRQTQRLGEQRGIQVELGPLEGVILGDATRLRQVLLILLDNSLRNTPSGGKIRLETAIQGRNAHIIVSDTGRGIPAEHLPHVFERFYKVTDTLDAEQRRSGLGLSLARRFVEAQGGRIQMTSQEGQGTTVTLRMPLL